MWCFFFQAEDGIRDLVRSRGLGDVYKRQGVDKVLLPKHLVTQHLQLRLLVVVDADKDHPIVAVSYTHLTLPTSDLV